MGEWKTYRLGEIATIKGGKRLPKGVNLIKIRNSHPYIRIRDIGKTKNIELDSTYEYVDDDTQKTIARYIVQEGDILISIVGTIGLVGIVGKSLDSANLTENCVKLTNLRGVEKDFLFYFLKSEYGQNEINKGIVGAVQAKLPIKNIENIKIPIPSLEEQRRIAAILGALDDKIELNRRINANLEEQAQALFKSWFVDFEPFRDSPFVDSELGKIPQGWKVGTLSEIGAVIGGGTPSKIVSEYYTDNGIAWITPKDLSTNNCKFTSMGETDISELGYKNSSAKLMPRGSVLFSSRAPIGYISIAKNEICTNQGFKSIVPQKAGTCFIYYFLRNNTSKIESMASGSTFKEASGGLMKSLEVIIPTNKIFTAFEEAIQPLLDMQEHNEDENARLSVLRNTLQPKLMAGEINVENQ